MDLDAMEMGLKLSHKKIIISKYDSLIRLVYKVLWMVMLFVLFIVAMVLVGCLVKVLSQQIYWFLNKVYNTTFVGLVWLSVSIKVLLYKIHNKLCVHSILVLWVYFKYTRYIRHKHIE